MVEPLLRTPKVQTDRKTLRGYLMVSVAAVLFAVNGAVSKVILSTGLSSPRLSEVRSTGAFALLFVGILALRPQLLRVGRRELALLAEGLREAAAQRRRQPDADLDTLASSLGISRSAMNHRLRRLVELGAEAGAARSRRT